MLIGQSRGRTVRGRSFGPARPRSPCASEPLPRPPSPDWSIGSATALRASSGTRAVGDGEAGRPASPDDDLFSPRGSRDAAQTVFAAVVEDKGDRIGQALQRRNVRPSLAGAPRDARAI